MREGYIYGRQWRPLQIRLSVSDATAAIKMSRTSVSWWHHDPVAWSWHRTVDEPGRVVMT